MVRSLEEFLRKWLFSLEEACIQGIGDLPSNIWGVVYENAYFNLGGMLRNTPPLIETDLPFCRRAWPSIPRPLKILMLFGPGFLLLGILSKTSLECGKNFPTIMFTALLFTTWKS